MSIQEQYLKVMFQNKPQTYTAKPMEKTTFPANTRLLKADATRTDNCLVLLRHSIDKEAALKLTAGLHAALLFI